MVTVTDVTVSHNAQCVTAMLPRGLVSSGTVLRSSFLLAYAAVDEHAAGQQSSFFGFERNERLHHESANHNLKPRALQAPSPASMTSAVVIRVLSCTNLEQKRNSCETINAKTHVTDLLFFVLAVKQHKKIKESPDSCQCAGLLNLVTEASESFTSFIYRCWSTGAGQQVLVNELE